MGIRLTETRKQIILMLLLAAQIYGVFYLLPLYTDTWFLVAGLLILISTSFLCVWYIGFRTKLEVGLLLTTAVILTIVSRLGVGW